MLFRSYYKSSGNKLYIYGYDLRYLFKQKPVINNQTKTSVRQSMTGM